MRSKHPFFIGVKVRSLHKAVSVLTLCIFLCGQFDFALTTAGAETSQTPTSLSAPLSVPPEIGTVRETFSGKTAAPVILIEDAHAVPEAQEHIRALIQHFESTQNPALIGLEGAAGKLDAQFLRSFPDKSNLKRVVKKFADQNEITGGVQAALLSEGGENYRGLENQNLYEEGIDFYQRSVFSSAQLLREIEKVQARLNQRKAAVYSNDLLRLDSMISAFHKDASRLPEIFESFRKHLRPSQGSRLESILRIYEKQDSEFQKQAEELNAILAQAKTISRQTLIDEKDLRALNEKEQAYQTRQIRPSAFALFLQTWLKRHGALVSFSEKWQSLILDEENLARLEGNLLSQELNAALTAAFNREARLQSKNNSAAYAEITRLNKTHILLRYLRKLASLELNREDWLRIKKTGIFNKLPPVYSAAFSNQLAFYQNAEARETAMTQTLFEADQSRPAVIVAGGFHTEGLKLKLKEHGRTYWVATPKINGVPAQDNYRAQMLGQSAWQNYFEIQNGKISVHGAFMRAFRDELLKDTTPNSRTFILKEWRNQIIRDWAVKKSSVKAGYSTRFLDELTQAENPLLKKAEALISGLKKLEAASQLTEQNILKLFGPSAIPPVAAGNAILSDHPVSARLLLQRSESRPNIGLLDPHIYTPQAMAWFAEQAKDMSDYLAQAENHTQAIRDLLWDQGISYWDVRHAIYPGSHDDAETIVSLLKIFPNIRTVTPVSLTAGFAGEQEKQMNAHWENRLREVASRQDVKISKNFLLRALNRNYFHSDNLSLRATLREITVFVDKYPGHNSSMRSDPAYRTGLLRDAKPGDLLFSLPDRHVPQLKWAQRPLAEKLNLPFLYKHRNWQITRFSGEDFPLRSESRKHDEVITLIDQSLTRAGIDRFSVTKLLYPAALYDAKAVISLLEVFPNIRELIINDLYFKDEPERPILEEWKKQLAQAAQTAGAKFDTARLTIKIDGGDYLKSKPAAFADKKNRTLILDKNPGSVSYLRSNPNYLKAILRDAHPGDLVVSLITRLAPMLEWKTPAAAHYIELPYYENAQWSITALSNEDFKRSENRKQDRHYHKRSDYAYSQDFDRVEELLSRLQKKHGGGKRQILAQLSTWQKKEEDKLKKRHGENGRLGHLHERVYAPLQIIVGHLDNPKFYPNVTDAIIDFFFEIERVDTPRFLWLLDILLQDAAFERHSKNPRQRAQGEASDAILRKMLLRADAQNHKVLELIKAQIQNSAQKYARAQKTAENILKSYKPDPIGSIFISVFQQVDITFLFDENKRSEARAHLNKGVSTIRESFAAFLIHLARQFSKLLWVEKALLKTANKLHPPAIKPEPEAVEIAPLPENEENAVAMTLLAKTRYNRLLESLNPEDKELFLKSRMHLSRIRDGFRARASTQDVKKLIDWSFGWNIPDESGIFWDTLKGKWEPILLHPAYLRFLKGTASADFLAEASRQAQRQGLTPDDLLARFLIDLRFLEFFTASQLIEKRSLPFRGALTYEFTHSHSFDGKSPHLSKSKKRVILLDESFVARILGGTTHPEAREAQIADLIQALLEYWLPRRTETVREDEKEDLLNESPRRQDANILAAQLVKSDTFKALFRFQDPQSSDQPRSLPRSEARALETLAKDGVAALGQNRPSPTLAREIRALIPKQISADTFGVYLRSEARKIAASSVSMTSEPKVTRSQAGIFIDSVLKYLQKVTGQEKPAVGFTDSADASFIEALEKTKSLLGLAVLSKQTAATLTRKHLHGVAFKIVSGFENYKTETALPLISRRFSDALAFGSGLFGLEISDGGIEDEPFLETAEKILQITAGVLLAAKITNPEDLNNPVKMAGFIQDLNRELFGAGAPDIFKWERRKLQIQRSILIGLIQELAAHQAAKVSA